MKLRNKKIRIVLFIVLPILMVIVSSLLFFGECFKKVNLWGRMTEAYEEHLTESGLRVLFLRDQSLPSIQYQIFFPKAGADYDFENKSGLSTLTAYLSEQGAGGLSSEALQEELSQLGAKLDITITRQTTAITLKGLSWHGEKLWDFFQKIVSKPHFQEEELEILRSQFLENRFLMLDDPSAVARAAWRRMLFSGEVGLERGGNLISLSKISLKDIKQFYKRRYLEGEPILMVVGQYDKNLKKRILSFFNKHFSKSTRPQKDFSVSNLQPRFILLTNKGQVRAQVVLGYSLEAFPAKNPKAYLIRKLANHVLGEGGIMTSRFFVELREKRGLTYSTRSTLDFGKYYGMFSFSGATKTKSVRELLDQILVVLKTFRTQGITPEELDGAKLNLHNHHLFHLETPDHWLEHKAEYSYYLHAQDLFDHYTDILDSITLEEVNQSISSFVLSKPLQVLVYGHPTIESQLKGLEGYPPIEQISFKDYFAEELQFKK